LEPGTRLRYAAAMPTTTIDIILTILFALGLAQLAWFSVMLLRRGLSPSTICASLPPLIAIWVVLWPLYESASSLWTGIVLLGLPILLVYGIRKPFTAQLRIAWSGRAVPGEEQAPLPHMWSFVSMLTALTIAVAFFQRAPELGLGIGLSACLAFPAASLLDRIGYLKLGFPLHPEQTLIGHIGLIIVVSLLCTWSIQVYHGIEWQRLLIATLIAGMATSIARAFSPTGTVMPLATLAMGGTLWLL